VHVSFPAVQGFLNFGETQFTTILSHYSPPCNHGLISKKAFWGQAEGPQGPRARATVNKSEHFMLESHSNNQSDSKWILREIK